MVCRTVNLADNFTLCRQEPAKGLALAEPSPPSLVVCSTLALLLSPRPHALPAMATPRLDHRSPHFAPTPRGVGEAPRLRAQKIRPPRTSQVSRMSNSKQAPEVRFAFAMSDSLNESNAIRARKAATAKGLGLSRRRSHGMAGLI